MKRVFEMLRNIDKLIFTSSSMGNSEMGWNYNGIGNTLVTFDNNKVYFLDRITIDDKLSYEDKKMWTLKEDILEFWHFRNNIYEKIFVFSKYGDDTYITDSYECSDDIYLGKIKVDDGKLIFMIEIKSNKKNELIKYEYLKIRS